MGIAANGVLYFKHFIDSLTYRFKEKPKGLDFSRNEYPYDDDSDNIWYERTQPKHIRRIFSQIGDKSRPFLDLGCGKGYLLYELTKLGFTNVSGIEYTTEIADIAKKNMEVLGLSDVVTIINMDARDFTAFDDFEIIYMFHPFKKPVMEIVVRHIEESLERNPRPFTAVYFHPVEHMLFSSSPYFERTVSLKFEFLNTELDLFYFEHNPKKYAQRKNIRFKDILAKKLEL